MEDDSMNLPMDVIRLIAEFVNKDSAEKIADNFVKCEFIRVGAKYYYFLLAIDINVKNLRIKTAFPFKARVAEEKIVILSKELEKNGGEYCGTRSISGGILNIKISSAKLISLIMDCIEIKKECRLSAANIIYLCSLMKTASARTRISISENWEFWKYVKMKCHKITLNGRDFSFSFEYIVAQDHINFGLFHISFKRPYIIDFKRRHYLKECRKSDCMYYKKDNKDAEKIYIRQTPRS